MEHAMPISLGQHPRAGLYLRRAVGGLALLAMHEADALSRHAVELRERAAVAFKSRGLGELVRNQLDLVPETRARLAMDHRERRALLHSWIEDLRGGLRAAA